ncbi:Vesicle transport protein USE1 [Manis javanica]|nr:Vesicle transport protein USE1 [Manis javanica]
MALEIAAQAACPLLHWGEPQGALSWYDDFVGIVVHPGDAVARRQSMDEAGVIHDYDEVIMGEAMHGGPVMLSWQAIGAGRGSHASHHGHGGQPANVVIHEFAHKIDMRNGGADGCPPLPPGFRARSSARQAARYGRPPGRRPTTPFVSRSPSPSALAANGPGWMAMAPRRPPVSSPWPARPSSWTAPALPWNFPRWRHCWLRSSSRPPVNLIGANLLQGLGEQALLLVLPARLALEQGDGWQGPAKTVAHNAHARDAHQFLGNVGRHDGHGPLIGRHQFADHLGRERFHKRRRRLHARAQKKSVICSRMGVRRWPSTQSSPVSSAHCRGRRPSRVARLRWAIRRGSCS